MSVKLDRKIFLVGIATYLVMLALAVVFYKERMVLLDASYALFHILKENSFSIEFHRFPDAVVQFLPLLGSRLGWGLSQIMISYSVSFVLVYFVCYLITGLVLKQYKFTLVILLVNILFVSDTYYYTPSQLPQGMCFMMLLFAFLRQRNIFIGSKAQKIFSYLFLTLSIIILAFFHPLIIFALVYSLGFFVIRKELFNDKRLLFIIVITFISVLIFKSIALRTVYETHSLGGLRNFYLKFPNYANLYSNQQFLKGCVTKFYWIPLLFTSIVVLYIKRKERLKLLFFAGYFLAYLLLINISYPDKLTPVFYIENLYLPLGLFLALPFVFDLLPLLINKKLALLIVGLIALTGIIRIYAMHPIYTARVNWERAAMNTYKGKKVVVDAKFAPMDTLMMVWGTPYEFWLLSMSEGDTTASIIVDAKPEIQGWLRPQTNGFYVNWMLYSYNDFKGNKYFKFVDTVSGYVIIK